MLKNVKRLNIKHFQEKPCFLKLRKKEIFDIIEIFHAKLIMVMSLVYLNFIFDIFLLKCYAPDTHSNNYS